MLTKPIVQAFVAQAHKRSYPPKHTILHAGDTPTTLYLILEGSVSVLLEDKGKAVALHYRQAANLHDMLEQQVHALARRHGGNDVHVQPGAYVLELKPSGITKAHAIEAFMQEPPFRGRTPLFAGDDLTDLHGFDAVERLGGVSIAVGPRVSAMVQAATPGELRALLEEFLAREAAA